MESHKNLREQPEDVTAQTLLQISTQLASFTLNGNFLNSTIPPPRSFVPPLFSVHTNTLWTLSLITALITASIGILVKQWLYEATIGGTSHESARLRQYRLNRLLKWRVGTIVVVLPIMLQLASTLFLVGLLVLLWTLHSTVAAVTSTIVVALFVFFLVVILLPFSTPMRSASIYTVASCCGPGSSRPPSRPRSSHL